ncbi:hypothetical protein GQR58_029267 [Nymphon striatum]|nr:hypothetical protein GQR58_029267 [Nymphon striatum]
MSWLQGAPTVLDVTRCVQSLVAAICLTLLAGCTVGSSPVDPAAFPAPTEEPTEVPTVAPTAVPVGWCTGLASQLQESLTAAVGRRHPRRRESRSSVPAAARHVP